VVCIHTQFGDIKENYSFTKIYLFIYSYHLTFNVIFKYKIDLRISIMSCVPFYAYAHIYLQYTLRILYRQMRACAWNGTQLWLRVEPSERVKRRDSLTRSARCESSHQSEWKGEILSLARRAASRAIRVSEKEGFSCSLGAPNLIERSLSHG